VNDKFKYYPRNINDKISTNLLTKDYTNIVHEAKIIVTYDQDFCDYMRSVREKRIEKALKIIANPPSFSKQTSKDG
jgi:hypothetical protein